MYMQSNTRIVFVGHSLGGLVIKQVGNVVINMPRSTALTYEGTPQRLTRPQLRIDSQSNVRPSIFRRPTPWCEWSAIREACGWPDEVRFQWPS
jgi:hypothetical protein